MARSLFNSGAWHLSVHLHGAWTVPKQAMSIPRNTLAESWEKEYSILVLLSNILEFIQLRLCCCQARGELLQLSFPSFLRIRCHGSDLRLPPIDLTLRRGNHCSCRTRSPLGVTNSLLRLKHIS